MAKKLREVESTMVKNFTEEQTKFMRQACLLCDRSSLEVRTGCLIVKDDVVLGEGWNIEHGTFSADAGILHAESMAISKALQQDADLREDADLRGETDLRGATAYITRFPCIDCARELVKQGITRLFYMSDHFSSGNEALPVFKSAGVAVCQIPQEVVWK